ncbi:hypothetical protein HK102_006917 [Quaeritorhiza haematococci]|nr:hypothetical protein HK102_006917 [Quaeritorhiza haematococci]
MEPPQIDDGDHGPEEEYDSKEPIQQYEAQDVNGEEGERVDGGGLEGAKDQSQIEEPSPSQHLEDDSSANEQAQPSSDAVSAPETGSAGIDSVNPNSTVSGDLLTETLQPYSTNEVGHLHSDTGSFGAILDTDFESQQLTNTISQADNALQQPPAATRSAGGPKTPVAAPPTPSQPKPSSGAPAEPDFVSDPNATILLEEKLRRNAFFSEKEIEFDETLHTLEESGAYEGDNLSLLGKFRAEYEKVHRAILRSHTHAEALYEDVKELAEEYRENLNLTQEAVKNSVRDQQVIRTLRQQIRRSEELVEASNKREESSKEQLRLLHSDIKSLSTALKEGVGLSVMQERTLQELTHAKENAMREVEAETEKVVLLRNQIAEVSETVRTTDNRKRELEQEIYQLKEKNAMKKTDIDAELRVKERLERELRELRVVVAGRTQEVRGKQESVNRSNEELAILDLQIKSQKQTLEKLLKDQENLTTRTIKLQEERSEHFSSTVGLIEDNEVLAQDLKQKEADLTKNRNEVKKVNRIREGLIKKNKALEEHRGACELERKDLRAKNETTLQQTETLRRQIEMNKKVVDDLVREKDILRRSHQKAQNETINQTNMTVIYQQIKHNLEVELSQLQKDIQHHHKQIEQVTSERDHYVGEATKLQGMCVASLQQIKETELLIFERKRKMVQSDTKLKHQQALYEAVQSDRNLHSKHLLESQAEIAEMKRKLKIMNYQINGFKEDINVKDDALVREMLENQHLQKDINLINEEIETLKSQNEIAQTYIRAQLAEEFKLNQFVKEAERERARQENALQVLITERDNLSSQLIRQNTELARVYDALKTKQSLLLHSETHYRDRLRAMRSLREEIFLLRQNKAMLMGDTADLPAMKKSIYRLQNDIIRERSRVKALEDELRNPVNIHRWRKLEGSNPKAFELLQLLHTLQKKVIVKTREDRQKEHLIQTKEETYLHLRSVLGKQVGPEAQEQVKEFKNILKEKNMQLRHMDSELNMYQAQVREYRYAIGVLDKGLGEIKKQYITSQLARAAMGGGGLQTKMAWAKAQGGGGGGERPLSPMSLPAISPIPRTSANGTPTRMSQTFAAEEGNDGGTQQALAPLAPSPGIDPSEENEGREELLDGDNNPEPIVVASI